MGIEGPSNKDIKTFMGVPVIVDPSLKPGEGYVLNPETWRTTMNTLAAKHSPTQQFVISNETYQKFMGIDWSTNAEPPAVWGPKSKEIKL